MDIAELFIGLASLFLSLVAAGGTALAWFYRRLDRRFDEARDERKQLRADLTRLQADATGLRADLSKLQGEMTQLRADLSRLQDEVTQLQVEFANRISKVEGLVEGMWKALALRFGAEPPPEAAER